LRVKLSPYAQPEDLPSPDTLPAQVFRKIAAEILRDGKMLRFAAYGNSMRPQIQHGDIITIKPISHLPRVGDVIMIITDAATAKIMVHRIAARTATTITTRGDACTTPDGEFPHSAILGILARVERNGTPVNWVLPWHMHLHPQFRQILRKLYYRMKGGRS